MRALLSWLILPLSLLWVFALISLFFFVKGGKKAGKICLTITAVWFLICSTSFFPDLLISALEDSYKPLLNVSAFRNDTLLNIMVLGGGHTIDKSLPANNQLAGNALGRLVEGIRLYRLLPNSKLIVSGWAGSQPQTQAEVLAATALSLGVDSNRLILFKNPRTTFEESKTYASVFGNKSKLILVTDAAHMPRAMKLFHKQSINPIASPTNHIFKKGASFRFINKLPSAANLSKFEYATHEYIGILWSYIEN